MTQDLLDLINAIENNDMLKFMLLLESGTNFNVPFYMIDMSAIRSAIKTNNIFALETLFAHGADVHLDHRTGLKAIHYCVHWENLEALKMVLAHGGNVNAVAERAHRVTPLHIAVTKSETPVNIEIFKILLAEGAKVDNLDSSSKTAAFIAHFNRNLKMLRLLEERGAYIHY